jgi:hypothetical protein
MTDSPGWGSLPTSSKVLCAVYGAIAVAAAGLTIWVDMG